MTDELRAKFEAWVTDNDGVFDHIDFSRDRHGDYISLEMSAAFNAYASRDAEVEALQEQRLLKLLVDIRFAAGDNGKRMQDELVPFFEALKRDAEIGRYVLGHAEWIRDENDTLMAIRFAGHVDLSSVGTRRDAIDAAMRDND